VPETAAGQRSTAAGGAVGGSRTGRADGSGVRPGADVGLRTASGSGTGAVAAHVSRDRQAAESGESMRRNYRRGRTLCGMAGIVVAVVVGVVLGALVGAVAGVVAAIVAGVLVGLSAWRFSTSWVLRLIGGRPIEHGEEPRLENLVDGLCATFGIRSPKLVEVDDPLPNSCSLGTSSSRTYLVVTRGLLERLGLVEMEGVVAHELAHVKRGDTVLSSIVTTVLGPWAWLSGSDQWLHRALGRGREFRADDLAVSTVRYPPGLQRALDEMSSSGSGAEDGSPVPSASAFTGRRLFMMRWLWIDPLVGPVAHAGQPERRAGRALDFDDRIDMSCVRAEALAQR
jgi:Zn-dependent protease with chaperone function